MIITFHMAVYIVQRIWEIINYNLFDSANNNQGLDNSNSGENNSSNEIDDNNGFQNNLDTSNYSSLIEPRPTHNQILPSLSRPIHNQILPSLDRPIEYELNSNSQEDQDVIENTWFGDQIETDIRKLIYDTKPKFECLCDEKGMRFIPPVYIQRYIMVDSILKEPCWASKVKKIVDFGCAELKFESLYLKKLLGIEEILAVDLDEELLRYNSCRLSPSIPDYLQRRPSPLKIKIFSGSVAHTNEALVGCDAVVAIELIEHLYPPDLENLPFTVFGFIKPSIAIFTTPNADFNVLFTNFSGFRHDDHKFEWTRLEFEAWANNLTTRYPEYSVTFQGVGPGPAGIDNLGCCSQMATFVRVYGHPRTEEFEMHFQDGEYKLINEYIYPFEERTQEEIIRDEAIAFINKSILLNKRYNEHVVKEIHLKTIMEMSKCFNREKLKNILRENNWQVETRENGNEVIIVPDSDSEDELSSNISEEYHEQEQHFDDGMEFSNVDENWDSNGKESNNCLNNTSNSDLVNSDNEWYNITHNDSVVYGSNKVGSESEASVSNLDDNRSNYRSDTLSEEELGTDCSINKTSTINESHGENEKPKLFCCLSDALLVSDESSKSESSFSNDNVVSPFNSSVYTTPRCSKFHKNDITKSLSLQDMNSDFDLSSEFTELNSLSKLPDLTLDQRDKVSKSMEEFKTQDSCDIQKNSTNDSKAIDSGYLDSCSEHIMDLDLTPEQFDDIETGSEGNETGSLSASPLEPPVRILHVIDDVENGDVVNNNRDGEGNNMVADIEEELLDFEAQIEEINDEGPNLAEGHQLHLQGIYHCRKESLSPEEMYVDMEVESQEFEAKIEGINNDFDLTRQNAFDCNVISPGEHSNILEKSIDFNAQIEETNKNVSGCAKANEPSILIHQKFDNFSNKFNLSQESCFALPNFCVEDSNLKPSPLDHVLEENEISKPSSVINLVPENQMCQTDLCKARSNSECHLNSSKSTTGSCSNGSINKNDTNHETSELTKYNSLTTVIDGCSKFSECSLVQPIHIFPKWMQRINTFENETCEKIDGGNNTLTRENDMRMRHLPSSDQVTVSTSSDYESFSSLLSDSENCPFPTWLLKINLVEVEDYNLENRISETSDTDIESFEDFSQSHHHEPIDAKGGGDQDSIH